MTKEKNRHSYSEEEMRTVWEEICFEVADGSNLERIGNDPRFPSKPTLYKWLNTHDDLFNDYARARTARADARADRIDSYVLEVKEGKLDPQAARVMIDAEKWQAGKENSARYGDKLELNGSLETKLSDEQLESQLTKLLGKATASQTVAGEGETEEA